MNKSTTDFDDSRMETTENRRSVLPREYPKKVSVTKAPNSLMVVLKANYLRSEDGSAEVVVNLDRAAFSRSLLVKKINRTLNGSDLENGDNRSDVYSAD